MSTSNPVSIANIVVPAGNRGSGGVLGQASAEWSRRRPDESYASLEGLHQVVLARTKRAKEIGGVEYAELRTEAHGAEVKLIGKANIPAKFTHWAFGQLCKVMESPAGFLRQLPATLASQVLNHRLARKGAAAGSCKLLVDQNGETKVRALTGEGYARIWDAEITSRLIGMGERGWFPAPETDLHTAVKCTAAGCVEGSTLTGDESCTTCGGSGQVAAKSRGLYASDHDVFAFMVDNTRRIFEEEPGGGLSRGFMVANSEVGDKSFWLMTFLYSYVCANHNVWGVQGVGELRIRHVGEAGARAWSEMDVELRKYAEASAQTDEARILRCRAHELGKTKEEVLDKVFGMRGLDLRKAKIEAAWERAEEHEGWYGAPPNSAWGFGNGVTEIAREIEFADQRVEVERAAGRIFAEAGF